MEHMKRVVLPSSLRSIVALPRAVWFTFNLTLGTDSLPQEQDGIQNILQIIVNANTTEVQLQSILISLGFIWKARNDKYFNNKTWSTIQVHSAVAAMLANLNNDDPCSSNNPNHQDSNNATHHNAAQTNHSTSQATPNTIQHLSLVQVHTQQGYHPSTTRSRDTPFSTAGPNDRDLYLVRLPALLRGVRCYIDASTSPDLSSNSSRNAGIGIFIISN
jgi:hypothetical protein